VRTERRCEANPQSGAETARVWEEIRKALTVAAWLQDTGNAHFRVRNFEQELSQELEALDTERMTFDLVQGKRAFGADPAGQLSQLGFVQRNGEELIFYGPDAELLISPEFLAQHCFHLQRSRARPGLLGLAFQPIRGRRQSEIKGALWLDESSGALRFVEYEFTNLGFSIDARFANGRTDFEQLPNGAWIVRNWVMTLPSLQETRVPRRPDVSGARRQGGEVLDVLIDDTTSVRLVPRFRVTGSVRDSLRNAPLTNARVYLAGTPLETRTDARGAFVLDSVPRGAYYISVHAQRLDSIPAAAPNLRIQVDSTLLPIRLATPDPAELLAQFCSPEEFRKLALLQKVTVNQLGVVRVEVIDDQTGAPVDNVTVRLSSNAAVPRSDLGAASTHALQTSTNVLGQATLCGADIQQPFTVELRMGRRSERAGPFSLPPERALRLVLRLPPAEQ
jgi:hypothetical protein